MLVNKEVKPYQEKFIALHNINRFFVLGGESVVSPEIFDTLKKYGEPSRIAGDDRYATSRLIARVFNPEADTVILTTGQTFPDGLSASNLGNYPLILADPEHTTEARKYISTLNMSKALVVGGMTNETADWCLTKLPSAASLH